ncbi:hypothetical protein [Nocardia bovistercoris]|uniref:DUF3558 domain-containing protein n=1 Tax=Nocardia bovistercoris TaxID=2785916 RepID=A0A931II63_9NOCA|nr:hypothetical protein [Nocardia bovistercoris]MBH0781886.1 hypothetical protein [Nocardia bovistercoris]
MNKKRLSATIFVLAAALSTACTDLTQAPVTATPTSAVFAVATVQDMCDALSNFFTGTLAVQDVDIRPADDPKSAIYGSGACSLETGPDMVARGSISLVDDSGANWTPGPTTKAMNGTSQPAWLFDGRPYGLIEITVRDADRQGILQIHQEHARTADGPLALTDTQLHEVAEFCIRMTRYLTR